MAAKTETGRDVSAAEVDVLSNQSKHDFIPLFPDLFTNVLYILGRTPAAVIGPVETPGARRRSSLVTSTEPLDCVVDRLD